MAARSKKKDIRQSLADQEAQNTIIEDLAMMPESAQESFVINDGEMIADDANILPQGFTQPGNLEADDNDEVTMNTNADLPENDASDETAIEDSVEPVINLDPALSIQNVVKLYDKLKRSYNAFDSIEIDASHVTSIDTATLQLFVALKKDAKKHNKEVAFFQPSDRLVESARLLDLLDILEITHI